MAGSQFTQAYNSPRLTIFPGLQFTPRGTVRGRVFERDLESMPRAENMNIKVSFLQHERSYIAVPGIVNQRSCEHFPDVQLRASRIVISTSTLFLA